jgi:hypothetical protein
MLATGAGQLLDYFVEENGSAVYFENLGLVPTNAPTGHVEYWERNVR